MKVLLIQPPHYYPPNKTRRPYSFPLGLGYIAKQLLKSGHDIDILDIWAHQMSNAEVLEKIEDLDYDIIGIGALSTQYAYVKWLTAQIKKYNQSKIVIGNALATLSPHIVLENTDADINVIGEGEITFREVVEKVDNLSEVKGIWYKKDGKILQNPAREYIQDLDTIEFPQRDLFPEDIYLKESRIFGREDLKVTNIISSRGCPYRCNYCSKTFSGVRFRSVDNIIEEIKQLKEKYGITGIIFNDELFIIDKERVYGFCDKIKSLDLLWQAQGRVDIVDLKLLRYMRQAGCVNIGYGIESGSQNILNNMNKGITVEEQKRAIKDTLRAGIMPIIQMMYGYPGETRETLKDTVHLFSKIPYIGYIGILIASNLAPTTPLPGTELYEQAIKKGLIEKEEEFLENLSVGCMFDGARPLANFTEFNNSEYEQIRIQTQRRIFSTHLKRHILLFAKEYLFRSISPMLLVVRKYGWMYAVRKTVRTLLKLYHLIFINRDKELNSTDFHE